MTISLYLVDDHAVFRRYLRQLLDGQPDLRVIGDADDAEQALALARQCAPAALADVVLMDIAMPGINGIELARRLRELSPATRMLALSMHDDPAFVDAMLSAGAQGFLLKSDPLEVMLLAIRTVAAMHRGAPEGF